MDSFLGISGLGTVIEQQWKTDVRPNSCGVDKRDGRAEGNREATGILRWFLNQPHA
jgi:hypothetical protein